MFSWASQSLEKLAQTVAPPPADAASRFVYCVQRDDESGAQGCLAEMDPFSIVQPTKGTYPLHLACLHGMERLIRQLMSIPGSNIQIADGAGNTPLHYACMSTNNKTAMHTVQLLITQFQASVVAKNFIHQTPYDVASINSIRQYLLPIQLQQETQYALDNGGVGLPPGIDLGGLRIKNSAMPPPPVGGMTGPPTPAGPPQPHTQSTPFGTPSPSQGPPSYGSAPPPPPSSGDSVNSGPHQHARTGHSTAGVMPSNSKYRPDGFHSSSSDVNLQKKYGHVSSGNLAAVPPPPSSGNSSIAAPPPSSGGSNPYARGGAIATRSRYLAYDGTSVGAPSSGNGSFGYYGVPPAAPTSGGFTTFNPAAAPSSGGYQQHQQAYQQPAAAPVFQQPAQGYDQGYDQYQNSSAYDQQAYQQPHDQQAYQQPHNQQAYQQEQPAPVYPSPQQQQYQSPAASSFLPPPPMSSLNQTQSLHGAPAASPYQAPAASPYQAPAPAASPYAPSSAGASPYAHQHRKPQDAVAAFSAASPQDVATTFSTPLRAPPIPAQQPVQSAISSGSTASAQDLFAGPSPSIVPAETISQESPADAFSQPAPEQQSPADTFSQPAAAQQSSAEAFSQPSPLQQSPTEALSEPGLQSPTEAFSQPALAARVVTEDSVTSPEANAASFFGSPSAASEKGASPSRDRKSVPTPEPLEDSDVMEDVPLFSPEVPEAPKSAQDFFGLPPPPTFSTK